MRKYILPCIGLSIVGCIGLFVCAFIMDATGLLDSTRATMTADSNLKVTEAAAANATASIIALTPTDTPTATASPTITLTPSQTPLPSDTPIPTDTPAPTATRTIEEEAANLIMNTRNTSLKDANIEDANVNTQTKVIVLRYAMEEALITSQYRTEADRDFILIICNLRDHGFEEYEYWFTATAPGTNSFGNDIQIEALEIELSAATAAKINCDNTSSVNLEDIAERYDLHPDLR